MSFTVTLSSPLSSSSTFSNNPKTHRFIYSPKSLTFKSKATKRNISSNINSNLNWNRPVINTQFLDQGSDDDNEDEDEDNRSLDLLVKFIQNVFKKVSKRARKAVRSVLPVSISTNLVGFSVNGVLILAFLWVLKAFLEVVCTIGSVVFVSILLIRGIWSGITYLQESRYLQMNELEDDHHEWTGAQPAA